MEIIYAGPHRNGRTAWEADQAREHTQQEPGDVTPALQEVTLEAEAAEPPGLLADRILAGGNLFLD